MSVSTIAASPLPLLGILCVHEHVCAHARMTNKMKMKNGKKETDERTEYFLLKKREFEKGRVASQII